MTYKELEEKLLLPSKTNIAVAVLCSAVMLASPFAGKLAAERAAQAEGMRELQLLEHSIPALTLGKASQVSVSPFASVVLDEGALGQTYNAKGIPLPQRKPRR